VVDRMLDLAAVGPGDYLIDLGSGDGRIVISAALRGAKGHGVDIDPERVREAEENAKASRVRDRVLFLEKDIFETEFRSASVVTMYLLSELNLRLESGLARFIFFGFVEGNSIEGIVQIRDRATQRVEPWRANK
jgi:ribosomal protein L11 methylase PrmA